MRIKLEKPKVPRVAVSPKAVVEEIAKKKPRRNAPRGSYGYVPPLKPLVSEKNPSEAKPRRGRKKITDEPIPERTNLEMRPLDEQEDFAHTKKSEQKPYWKAPENIPVAPKDFDDLTLKDIIGSPKAEDPSFEDTTAYLDQLEQEGAITLVSETHKEDPFTILESNPQEESSIAEHIQNKQIHDNPNGYELRDGKREKSSGHDNLKTMPMKKQERSNRGILRAIKGKLSDWTHKLEKKILGDEKYDDEWLDEWLDK